MQRVETITGPAASPLWRISGRVQMGKQLGRTIGFPTANIALDEASPMPHGIYVSLVRLNGGKRRGGVSYIGRRPTVDGDSLLLETHIFDFDQEIYGASAEVEIYEQVRGDACFDSLAALTAQIEQDCAVARRRLKALLQPAIDTAARRPGYGLEAYAGLLA